jgi:hypothetical protein
VTWVLYNVHQTENVTIDLFEPLLSSKVNGTDQVNGESAGTAMVVGCALALALALFTVAYAGRLTWLWHKSPAKQPGLRGCAVFSRRKTGENLGAAKRWFVERPVFVLWLVACAYLYNFVGDFSFLVTFWHSPLYWPTAVLRFPFSRPLQPEGFDFNVQKICNTVEQSASCPSWVRCRQNSAPQEPAGS